jgi:hypothetical protein
VKKLLLPVMALLVTASVSNAAINLVWKSDFGVFTEAGVGDGLTNMLPAGSIVQLVHAGADGVANDLNAGSADLVGGDDMVLDQLTILPTDIGGVIYGGVFTKGPIVYDTVGATDYLFIRAFNGSDLAAFSTTGGYYGNGPLQTGWNTELAPNPIPPLPDELRMDNGVTDIYFAGGGGSVIPEPSTVMLALAGALMVLRKLRK